MLDNNLHASNRLNQLFPKLFRLCPIPVVVDINITEVNPQIDDLSVLYI